MMFTKSEYNEQLLGRFKVDSKSSPTKSFCALFAGAMESNEEDGTPVRLALCSFVRFSQSYVWIFTDKYWYVFDLSATSVRWENSYTLPGEMAVTARQWDETLQIFGPNSLLVFLEKFGKPHLVARAADLLNEMQARRVEENLEQPLVAIYLGQIEASQGMARVQSNTPGYLVVHRDHIMLGNFGEELIQLPISSILDIEIGGPGYIPPQQTSGGGGSAYGFSFGF